MKRIKFVAVLLLTALPILTAGALPARGLEFENKTEEVITALFISPSTAANWSENLLPENYSIEPGQTVRIPKNKLEEDPDAPYFYDCRGVSENGTEFILLNASIKETGTLILLPEHAQIDVQESAEASFENDAYLQGYAQGYQDAYRDAYRAGFEAGKNN